MVDDQDSFKGMSESVNTSWIPTHVCADELVSFLALTSHSCTLLGSPSLLVSVSYRCAFDMVLSWLHDSHGKESNRWHHSVQHMVDA